jgi:hypothetical protein
MTRPLMSDQQVWCVVAVFAIIAAVTALEMLHWLPKGRAKFAILFAAGVSIVALLYTAGIPPDWFAGDSDGFVLAGTLLAGGFVTRGAGKSFGLPLLSGMGLTLLLLNVLAHL